MNHLHHRSQLAYVGVAALLVLASLACSSSTPTVAPAPQATSAPAAPAQPVATQPPVKETVVVTIVVQPTTTPTATPTSTATAKPGAVATKAPAQGAPLDFTAGDIEYGPSAPRKGDNKIQLTITLHPKGGVPPFKFNLDGVTEVSGLTFTFDWHNCNQSEPHTIILMSADGQQTKPVGFIYPYDNCK